MATKTKTKTKAPAHNVPPEAPIVGPQTKAEWFRATMKAISQEDASTTAREEYRKLLDLYPAVAAENGDLARLYQRNSLDRFKSQPVIEEAIKHQMGVIRAGLAGPSPSALEALLVDAVMLCYQDYWSFALIVEMKTGKSFTLSDMEKWERILSSKEARYLRAIGELARVRRLLNLPAPQVNINMPGGQQVNVQGDVKP